MNELTKDEEQVMQYVWKLEKEFLKDVGNTGLSSGPHLHYEVKQNGKQLNPLDYIE